MKTNQKYVRVQFKIGVVVPSDRKDMLDIARETMVEDIMNAVKHDEIYDWIEEVEVDAIANDVPEYIREICDEELDDYAN